MQKHLFQVSSNFMWTGIRELTYLQMMKTIVDDIDAVVPLAGKELFVQITYQAYVITKQKTPHEVKNGNAAGRAFFDVR